MKEGYKKTELGLIPSEWEIGTFEDILVPRKETFNPKVEGNESYVGLEHIEEGTGRLICTGNSSETRSTKNKFHSGDILFGKLRPYLRKYFLSNFSGVCVTEILVLTEKKSNNKFCYYNLQQDNFIEYINNKTFGTKMPRTSWTDIKEYPVCIPPLKEQEKISEILSTIDSQIDHTDKLIQKTKELKMGLMQRLLTKGIGHNELKVTEIGEIPVEWGLIELQDLGTTFVGLSGKTKVDFGKGKPYIPYKNIFNNSKIDIEYLDYVEISDGENQNKVKRGDIFFTTSSETAEEVGMSSVLLDDVKEVYLNSFCFGYRLNDFQKVLPEFLRFLLRGNYVRKYISKLAQGSTRFNLSKNAILNMEIPVPSLEEQKQIANILSSVDNEIEAYQNKKTKLNEFKKGLMQQLLAGKVRVKV